MPEAQEFAAHVVDLLQTFGRCEARRMFGGYGIFHRGLMFGLIADGSLYLKVDEHNRESFAAAGSEAFTYYKKNKPMRMSYYLAPEIFFDDEAACLRWARSAYDAALRNADKNNRNKNS